MAVPSTAPYRLAIVLRGLDWLDLQNNNKQQNKISSPLIGKFPLIHGFTKRFFPLIIFFSRCFFVLKIRHQIKKMHYYYFNEQVCFKCTVDSIKPFQSVWRGLHFFPSCGKRHIKKNVCLLICSARLNRIQCMLNAC